MPSSEHEIVVERRARPQPEDGGVRGQDRQRPPPGRLRKQRRGHDRIERASGGHGHAQQSILIDHATLQRHEHDHQEHAACRTAKPEIDGREPHLVHNMHSPIRVQLSHWPSVGTIQTCGR